MPALSVAATAQGFDEKPCVITHRTASRRKSYVCSTSIADRRDNVIVNSSLIKICFNTDRRLHDVLMCLTEIYQINLFQNNKTIIERTINCLITVRSNEEVILKFDREI